MSAKLYETDRAAWLEQQTLCLKSGQLADLDVEHLTEELELAMGNERREIYRLLRILIGHLLKWQYQPDQRSASWSGTIRVQRKDLQKLLKDSPSLRRFLDHRSRSIPSFHLKHLQRLRFPTGWLTIERRFLTTQERC